MKEKKPSPLDSISRKFDPALLYTSDLERVINLVHGRGLAISISDDEFEYDDLTDLKANRGGNVRKLCLRAASQEDRFGSMQLEVDDKGISLTATKHEKFSSLFYEVAELIKRRTPWYSSLMAPSVWGLGMLFVGGSLAGILPSRIRDAQPTTFAVVSCNILVPILLILFLMFLSSVLYLRKNRGICLQREHEIQGLWDRYGEKVLLMGVGSVLAVATKVLVDLIIK